MLSRPNETTVGNSIMKNVDQSVIIQCLFFNELVERFAPKVIIYNKNNFNAFKFGFIGVVCTIRTDYAVINFSPTRPIKIDALKSH